MPDKPAPKVVVNCTTGEVSVVELTQLEIADWHLRNADRTFDWQELRRQRDGLLKASDWTTAPDAPVDHAAWSAYRKALRDLPANTQDPREVVWPTPPA